MFDHVTIRVSDLAASARFYDTVLRTLGIERTHDGDELVEWDEFSIAPAPDGNSAEAVHHGKMRGGMVDHLWLRDR